jgi:hypothetical protein
MEKSKNSLKVYCEDDQLKDIETKLKSEIKCKYYCEGISYRGKNLNKVKEVLQNSLKDLRKGEFLKYEIQFQYRKV